jgi:putative ABC transport system permease protein
MTKLLQQYAYRISLDLWEFLAIGSAIILLLCLVVLIPYLKAATANPVESLKYE